MLRVFVFLSCLMALASGKAMQVGDKDFDKVVLNSGKNSLVKFLAPW